MSAAGVVRLFRTPTVASGEDGRMALADHLRELRARTLRSVVVIFIGMVVALFLYDHLLDLVLRPYNQAKDMLGGSVQTKAYIKGAGGPLLLQLKLSGIAGLVATSPYWLYQMGVHRSRTASQRAQVDKGLRRRGGSALHRRRRRRLLRAPQGPRGPDRVHPGEAREPRRVRGVLQLLH